MSGQSLEVRPFTLFVIYILYWKAFSGSILTCLRFSLFSFPFLPILSFTFFLFRSVPSPSLPFLLFSSPPYPPLFSSLPFFQIIVSPLAFLFGYYSLATPGGSFVDYWLFTLLLYLSVMGMANFITVLVPGKSKGLVANGIIVILWAFGGEIFLHYTLLWILSYCSVLYCTLRWKVLYCVLYSIV